MAEWEAGEKFDHQLNGYPITRNGRLVAIAVYSGGTEPARKNAELLVRALTLVEKMGDTIPSTNEAAPTSKVTSQDRGTL